MLLYPFLKLWFDIAMAIPTLVWLAIIALIIGIGILFGKEVRNAIAGMIFTPIAGYVICWFCESLQELPLLGPFLFVVRIVIDITVVVTLFLVIKTAIMSANDSSKK